ncbi:MAG: sugar phosphate isomerase/epimerase [Candidatus Altiarchaeota archaeon]|nr:sugar phosphate isomerase/epimerase [Candidatus Altiarchaeota archaeon]
MELGTSTARLWWFEKDLVRVMGFISQYFRAAEVWVEPPFFPGWRTSGEKAELDRLMDVLVVTELETTVHAPHHELGLCAWNPAVNSLAVREIVKSLDIASELDSKAVTFHTGRVRLDDESCRVRLRSNLESLNDVAGDYSCKLCLENPHDGFFSRLDNLLEVTEGLKNIYLTLDLAHLSMNEKDLGKFKSKLRRRVRNAHISRITREGKHKPLTAETKFLKDSLKTLKEIKYEGSMILDGFVGERAEDIIPKEIKTFERMVA